MEKNPYTNIRARYTDTIRVSFCCFAAAEQQNDIMPMVSFTTTLVTTMHQHPEVRSTVMANEKQLGSFLRHARLTAFESKTLLVSVPDDFHARALRNERAKLAHRLTEGTGHHVERIGFKVDAPTSSDPDLADDEVNAKETLEMLCEENPAVRALVERFGGEIVW